MTRTYATPVFLLLAFLIHAEGLHLEAGEAKGGEPNRSFQIELEDFTLTDCEVVTTTLACGGKAVLIAKESSKAVSSIKLPAGNYSVVIWTLAPSLKQDAVWVVIGDAGKDSQWEGKLKSFPDHKRMPMKEFMSAGVYVSDRERVVVRVTEDKDMKELPIVITPKKTGMQLDRIVFRRLDDAVKKPSPVAGPPKSP